ncbi:MAG: type II toxin-antitoxin system VapC family toxin [Candidatus Aenigmatarchaeota archaeon]
MVVLDSDILVGILRGDEKAIEYMDKLEKKEERLNTTAINAFELFEGAMLMRDKNKQEKVENLLKAFGSYSFNSPASWKAAEVSSGLKKTGKTVDFQDIAIASIALLHGETIVTRNIEHFGRIKNLKIEKW